MEEREKQNVKDSPTSGILLVRSGATVESGTQGYKVEGFLLLLRTKKAR
jgi:hypothetical protein